MAKDVDLSSKEWLEIVFDGKNKDFGAYQMRKSSIHRHTKSVIIVVSALTVILVVLILAMTGVFKFADEDSSAVNTEQELAQYAPEEAQEEEQEEEEVIIQQPEEELIYEEDVANEARVTDILIVEDDKFEEDKQVKDQSELKDLTSQFGAADVSDGVDDRTKETVKEKVIVDKPVVVEPEKVFNVAMVEQKPEFPGGEAAMYKWLSEHTNYPAAASEQGIEGRVIVEFVVSKTGAIENAHVVRGRHPALDQEAVRVVKAMPKWNPGRNNGQPVKVTYTLPVNFKLQK